GPVGERATIRVARVHRGVDEPRAVRLLRRIDGAIAPDSPAVRLDLDLHEAAIVVLDRAERAPVALRLRVVGSIDEETGGVRAVQDDTELQAGGRIGPVGDRES